MPSETASSEQVQGSAKWKHQSSRRRLLKAASRDVHLAPCQGLELGSNRKSVWAPGPLRRASHLQQTDTMPTEQMSTITRIWACCVDRVAMLTSILREPPPRRRADGCGASGIIVVSECGVLQGCLHIRQASRDRRESLQREKSAARTFARFWPGCRPRRPHAKPGSGTARRAVGSLARLMRYASGLRPACP